MDAKGRVKYRYKRPFRDGSTHVVWELLDFKFSMNGMPQAAGRAGVAGSEHGLDRPVPLKREEGRYCGKVLRFLQKTANL